MKSQLTKTTKERTLPPHPPSIICFPLQDYESYRNSVGMLHETWEEAACELDQCRLSQLRAQEEERRSEAEARAYERRGGAGGYFGSGGGRGGGRRVPFDERYYPSGSDDDDEDHDDPFNFFARECVVFCFLCVYVCFVCFFFLGFFQISFLPSFCENFV